MDRKRLLIIGVSLTINFLVSWTILPFAIPPFRGYAFSELMDVFLWQVVGAVGWPLAILGTILSLLSSNATVQPGPFLLTLTYPLMLFLLVRAAFCESSRRWEVVLLHLLLAFSFAVLWLQVLNGYDFMSG